MTGPAQFGPALGKASEECSTDAAQSPVVSSSF